MGALVGCARPSLVFNRLAIGVSGLQQEVLNELYLKQIADLQMFDYVNRINIKNGTKTCK